jgi:hypothetical protein
MGRLCAHPFLIAVHSIYSGGAIWIHEQKYKEKASPGNSISGIIRA